MAFWRRYPHGIVVFSSKDGKQRRLPRADTRHLDTQPDHNIEAWVRNWERAHEGLRSEVQALTDPDWIRRLEQYLAFMISEGRRPPTVAWHRQALRDWVLPYFLAADPKTPDPDQWRTKSARLLAHLQGLEVPLAGLRRATFAARRFWRWMCEEGMVIDTAQPLVLRNPRGASQPTPLAYTATPDDILRYVSTTQDPVLRLMALAGYFFSLRPFELFALRPRDFVAGTRAQQFDDAEAMRRLRLFDKLVVHVHRERDQANNFHPPKAHSAGHVACFDARAAKALVPLLNAADPEALVLPRRVDWCIKYWSRHALPVLGLTLKDLRRASLYHLGNRTEFAGAGLLLQRHARHKSFDTTQLYLRRPGEDQAEWSPLDLEA
jgi:hypothetical protein